MRTPFTSIKITVELYNYLSKLREEWKLDSIRAVIEKIISERK